MVNNKYGIIITYDDLDRINWSFTNTVDAWLNDLIIDFYMQMLVHQRFIDPTLPKVFAFSSHFFHVYEQHGYEHVQRWTGQTDIFSCEYLFIPMLVNDDHWVMTIVHFPSNRIELYDSLKMTSKERETILNKIRAYLEAESLSKRYVLYDGAELESVKILNKQQVNNSSDCGVFCCMMARIYTLGQQFAIRQRHMSYARQLMAWEIINGQLKTGSEPEPVVELVQVPDQALMPEPELALVPDEPDVVLVPEQALEPEPDVIMLPEPDVELLPEPEFVLVPEPDLMEFEK